MQERFLYPLTIIGAGVLFGICVGAGLNCSEKKTEQAYPAHVNVTYQTIGSPLIGTYYEPAVIFSYGSTTNQDVINLLGIYGRDFLHSDVPWCLADEWARSGGLTIKELQGAGRNERYCGPRLPEKIEEHLYLFNAGVRERKDKMTIRFNEPKLEEEKSEMPKIVKKLFI